MTDRQEFRHLTKSSRPRSKHLLQQVFGRIKFSKEVSAVHVDDGSAPAGETLVRLESSDKLDRILPQLLQGMSMV